MDKIYIINDKPYKQIEIEVQGMDYDKAVIFCVDSEIEASCKEVIEDLFYACHFTTKEVLEELQELSLPAFYMCTIYDDSIVNEL